MTDPFEVGTCGHIRRVCRCETFQAAEDPDAATEAARARQETRERAYKQLQRAIAAHRFGDARELIHRLIGDDE